MQFENSIWKLCAFRYGVEQESRVNFPWGKLKIDSSGRQQSTDIQIFANALRNKMSLRLIRRDDMNRQIERY